MEKSFHPDDPPGSNVLIVKAINKRVLYEYGGKIWAQSCRYKHTPKMIISDTKLAIFKEWSEKINNCKTQVFMPLYNSPQAMSLTSKQLDAEAKKVMEAKDKGKLGYEMCLLWG